MSFKQLLFWIYGKFICKHDGAVTCVEYTPGCGGLWVCLQCSRKVR